MTEQTPEIVAAAELSPLSPRPLHTFTSSPISVPALQDQADNLDVASLDNLASANHLPIMAATHDADDTIVVAGSDESDASIADDDSFDAYGEDDDTQQQANEQGASNDDYANTFDSPPAQEADADQAASAAANTAPDSLSLAQPSKTLPNQASAALTSGDASPANPSSAQSATPSPPQPTEVAKPTADSQPDPVSRAANPNLPSQTAQPGPGSDEDSSSVPIDIEKLVDDLAAKAAAAPAPEPAHSSDEPSSAVLSQPPSSAPGPPQPSSLPPKPTMTQDAAHLNALPSSFHPSSTGGNPGYGASSASTGTASHAPFHVSSGQTSAHATPGAPGTSNDAVHTLPPPPSANFPGTPGSASYPQAQAYSNPAALPSQDPQPQDGQQSFDDFVADERRYMAEAKWERFPEGSRIFIGNLSQERVSKRDVFDLFHKYGRMAQISLKSAYGFVQYHSVADAQQAMEALQGIDVRGRKIHLEYSRTQKKDKDRDRDRDRSPDRSKNRGAARGTDRYDGRDKRGRDDWRATNDNAARRNSERLRDSRSSGYESFDRSRDRSRSPNRYGRRDNDSYRRRSPSPYGRSRHEGDGLDIPRRYGSDVPDVQLLLTQEVERGFVGWVERAFQDRGLKTDAMFLNPRFPRDTLIQRQVIEGVHAVVELNSRAQNFAKIPLQLFDRSAGTQNVRFDIYQDLDPPMAAELVLRARAGAPSNQPTYPPAPNAYGQSYAAPAQAFGQAYANPQGPPAPQGMPDLSGLVGHIDNATLQKVLAALQTSQAPGSGMSVPPPAYSPPGQQMAMPGAPATSTPQIDINALLGSIQSAAGGPSPPPGAGPYGYPGSGAPSMMAPAGAGMNPNAPGAGADSAQAVQSIMAQLAKFK